MRMILAASVVASAALVSAPAAAASAEAGRDGSKVVCKRESKTGTRFPTKICRTKAQWEALSEQHKRDAKEMIDRPQIEDRRG